MAWASGSFKDQEASSSRQFCRLPLVISGWQRVKEKKAAGSSLDSLEPVWVHGPVCGSARAPNGSAHACASPRPSVPGWCPQRLGWRGLARPCLC